MEYGQTTTTTSSSAIPNLPLSNNRQRLAGQAVLLLLLLRDGDGAGADNFFSGSIPNALAVGQARHRPAGNFGGQLLLLLGQHSPHVVPPATSSPLLFRRACLDNCGPIAQPLGCSENAALAGPCAMIGRRCRRGEALWMSVLGMAQRYLRPHRLRTDPDFHATPKNGNPCKNTRTHKTG